MEKVLGIIAEYNPLHNGHLYHITKSKELTSANYTIAVISGNFTERGDTSLIDKWKKAEMALKNGIDLVIELPVLYAISSAENFADGSIKILNSLGIVDYISFGAETDNINELNEIATVLANEPEEYKTLLNSELSKGISFPKARENALKEFVANDCITAMTKPNNILGIEYLKALKKYKSNIKSIAIKRHASNYNDLVYSNNIASATAIRQIVKNKEYEKLKNLLPKTSYTILNSAISNDEIVTGIDCFEKEILYALRKMDLKEIANLPDVCEGLEYSIKKAANSCSNIASLLESIKSKRYTATRIQRILLYALLGITKADMELSKKATPYIRILGFNENGKKLLSKISKANPNLELITSVKKFTTTTNNALLNKDILATNIYTLAYKGKANLDYTKRLEISL